VKKPRFAGVFLWPNAIARRPASKEFHFQIKRSRISEGHEGVPRQYGGTQGEPTVFDLKME